MYGFTAKSSVTPSTTMSLINKITQKWVALYSSGPSWLPFCALQSWLKALIVTDKPSRKFLDANSHVHAFNH